MNNIEQTIKEFPFQIILGSNSPRRHELLTSLGFKFLNKPINADESYPPTLEAEEIPLYLAEKKADAAGIKMAIGSAAILFNVDFVLDGLNIRNYFGALVSADDVVKSKPDAETFLKGAAALNVDPQNCIVFEDAPKGVEAALNANMKCVVITTMHTKEEFAAYANIIGFIEDYNDDILKQLLN